MLKTCLGRGKNTDVQLVLTRFHINVYDGSGWFRDISEGATIEHNGVLYDVVPRSCASDGGGPGDHLGAHELSDCTGGFMLPEGANNITIFKHGFLPHHSTIVVSLTPRVPKIRIDLTPSPPGQAERPHHGAIEMDIS